MTGQMPPEFRAQLINRSFPALKKGDRVAHYFRGTVDYGEVIGIRGFCIRVRLDKGGECSCNRMELRLVNKQ